MIDSACEAGGAVLSHLERNAYLGVDTTTLEHFVDVGSEFYSQLGAYYRARIDAWITARRRAEESDPDD